VIDSHFGSIESSNPITFLEVGCGKGSFTNLLKENYGDKINITAIDPSPEVVAIAKQRTNQPIEFQATGIFDFKTNKKFDVVMFTKSLHHCLPVTKALEIANSLLNENGIIISEEVFGDVIDDATLAWFFDRWDLMTQAGLFYRDYAKDPCDFEWEERLLDTSKSHRERWELFSQADCSTSKSVSQAIYSVFGEKNVKFTPSIAFWFHFPIYAG
ncbi:S-adenosyl-L-methionine-dependent methyltransferase, partial [Backusella circina FSU 941]